MEELLNILKDTIIDSIKMIPFLFIAYIIMEYIEHKTTNKTRNIIKKSGRFGPLVGSILGIFPQCGFSVMATNLYAGRVITLGTLFAVYLSTSDEMLPIMISKRVSWILIFKILGIKILIGLIIGFLVDLILVKRGKNNEGTQVDSIKSICEHDNCHCEDGIFKSALKHTFNIFVFIFIISLILNVVMEFVGKDIIQGVITDKLILGAIILGLIGLIPNCATSVILTELYLSGVLGKYGLALTIGGLLVNAGLGLLVLFKTNRNQKQNIKIIVSLYLIGVISAILLGFVSDSISLV